MKTLAQLLSVVGHTSEHDTQIDSLSLDSRKVQTGGLFFAYPGSVVDGRDYIHAAIGAGAAAIVYDPQSYQLPADLNVIAVAVDALQSKVGLIAAEFYGQPSSQLQVFGVTGTNGKTTCCTLFVQAFEAMGLKAAMMGTLGNGRLGELDKAGQTTPDPISVQRALRGYADAGVTQVCMEVSSHALDQGRVAGVDFYATLFTNLSHDHLDYHGDMTAYRQAKQRLFAEYNAELSVINVADPAGQIFFDTALAAFTVGFGVGGDVWVDEARLTETGIHLVIEGNGVEFELSTPLIGEVNVPNIELLVASLLALSTPLEQIVEIGKNLRPAPGRMELYRGKKTASVVVDYAHTPDALDKALRSVRAHCRGQLWCVFGCGGDRDKAKREVMGQLASQLADKVIVTNDNPRSEAPEQIAQDIAKGISGGYELILSRAEAIDFALSNAQIQDWILLAGKGHETTQEIGEQVLEFSDRQFVAQRLGVAA